jgi:hypothetical protein
MNLIVQKHLLGTEDISIRSAILRLSAAKTQTHAEKKDSNLQSVTNLGLSENSVPLHQMVNDH